MPGDKLRLACGLRVEVTSNDGNRVEWIVRRPYATDYTNGWSLASWRSTVARGATVMLVAAQEQSNG